MRPGPLLAAMAGVDGLRWRAAATVSALNLSQFRLSCVVFIVDMRSLLVNTSVTVSGMGHTHTHTHARAHTHNPHLRQLRRMMSRVAKEQSSKNAAFGIINTDTFVLLTSVPVATQARGDLPATLAAALPFVWPCEGGCRALCGRVWRARVCVLGVPVVVPSEKLPRRCGRLVATLECSTTLTPITLSSPNASRGSSVPTSTRSGFALPCAAEDVESTCVATS